MTQSQNSFFHVHTPTVVAYGAGVDSTAMLCGLIERGQRPDLILFADVGGEIKKTYDFIITMQSFLEKHSFPPITTVRYEAKNFKNWPPYYTLEDNCLTNGTLPGISFGPASCSMKWKQAPQHTFIKNWRPAQEIWAAGGRVIKLIGFDASPRDQRRTYSANPHDTHLYDYQMPLQTWGWDREECKRQIVHMGLPIPSKSACFFCLAMKPKEVEALDPDYLRRIIRMEARAAPRLKTCEGLWRSTIKGLRGAVARPGSMTQFIRDKKLLPADEIDQIWNSTPTEILAFQEGFAEAQAKGFEEAFISTSSQTDYRHPRREP